MVETHGQEIFSGFCKEFGAQTGTPLGAGGRGRVYMPTEIKGRLKLVQASLCQCMEGLESPLMEWGFYLAASREL